MKKNFIKLNIDDNHLSLGNLCRIIKDVAKNKASAMQVEIFCTLFSVDQINDTTVNNYCVGCRSINSDYKQIYLGYQNKYEQDKNYMIPKVLDLLQLIEGVILKEDNNSLNYINNNLTLKLVVSKLYNISKNDTSCSSEFSQLINNYINDNNLYEAFVNLLFFIILEKKQPLYENELKRNIIENVLNNTNISTKDLEEYLNIKLNEAVNFNYLLKKLSDEGNAYACFEMGYNELNGYITGSPRYNIAYNYFEKASLSNHAISYYFLGRLVLQNMVGNQTKKEYEIAYDNIKKSYELGCTAAINYLGLMYLNGIYPIKKDEKKAIKYFKEATSKDYTYAYNNLGKYYEESNYEKAHEYYKESARLGDSWANNKMGEYYRKNGEFKLAYEHYTRSINVPIDNVCFYAYYNLAKYYYLNGSNYISLESDKSKAIEYLDIASKNDCLEASILLFEIYVKDYLNKRTEDNYNNIIILKRRIETHDKYNKEIKKLIDNNLLVIKDNNLIDINLLD